MMQTIKEIGWVIIVILILLSLGGYIQQNGIVSKDTTQKAIFNFNYNCKTNENTNH